MADQSPEFESRDSEGETIHQSGTVGTSAIKLPTVAAGIIDEIEIERNKSTQSTMMIGIIMIVILAMRSKGNGSHEKTWQ